MPCFQSDFNDFTELCHDRFRNVVPSGEECEQAKNTCQMYLLYMEYRWIQVRNRNVRRNCFVEICCKFFHRRRHCENRKTFWRTHLQCQIRGSKTTFKVNFNSLVLKLGIISSSTYVDEILAIGDWGMTVGFYSNVGESVSSFLISIALTINFLD